MHSRGWKALGCWERVTHWGQHVDCTLGQGPSEPTAGSRCRVRPLAAAADRRQLAKRVQLVEGAMAALDHPCNDIVAPVTDGDLEHVEDLCRCEHRRPLPAAHDEDSRPQPLSDTVQRILEG